MIWRKLCPRHRLILPNLDMKNQPKLDTKDLGILLAIYISLYI